MSSTGNPPPPIHNSTLYQEFQAERSEIMRHKWYESEKAGYDVGYDYALTDWIMKHRAAWRRSRRDQTPRRPDEDRPGEGC